MNITYRLPHFLRTSPVLFAALFAILCVLGAATPAQAQTQKQADKCFSDYNGKQLTEQKYENQYKKSNCPASKDGNCTAKSTGNGSNVYFNITCSKKAGGGGGGTGKDKDSSTGCGGVETTFIRCDATGNGAIVNMLMVIINFMAIGVGILAVGGIVWGALLYTTSNGESAKAQQGITVIVNAVIGLLVFIFMYAIIDVLVPGGLF